MKTTATTTAVAAVLFALTACGDAAPVPDAGPPETPEVAAALDWIEAADMEFGAAPFSPPGWPYRVGDRIDDETRKQLGKRFPSFRGIAHVTWVDGRAFGAFYNWDAPGPDPIYEGHFPMKISRDGYERSQRMGTLLQPLPPGARLDLVLGDRFEKARQGLGHYGDPLDVLRARWHEPFRSRYGKDGTR